MSSTGTPVTISPVASSPTQLSATASGFTGTLTVAQFSGAPNTGFTTSGAYLDVNVQASNLSSAPAPMVLLHLHNLTANASLLWWNGSTWNAVTDGTGQIITADTSGNVAFTFTNTTSPTIAQLSGTYFCAGAVQPKFNVPAKQITYGTASATFTGTLSAGSLIPSGGVITATLVGAMT